MGLNEIAHSRSVEEADLSRLSSEKDLAIQTAPKRSQGVATVFDKDTLEKTPSDPEIQIQPSKNEASWLGNLFSRFTKTQPIENIVSPISPISNVPLLDDPEINPSILPAALPPSRNRQSEVIKIRDIDEIRAELSEKSINRIVQILMISMFGVDKDNVIAADTTLQKYNELRKNKTEVMQKIKDAILQDENLANRLKTPATVTAAASVICGLAAAAVSFGAAAPIGAALGATVGGAFMSLTGALAAAAPLTAAACAGMKGVEGYMKWHLDDEKAQELLVQHQDNYYDRLSNDGLNRLGKMGEGDAHYQDLYSKFIKRNQDLIRFVLQRPKKGE